MRPAMPRSFFFLPAPNPTVLALSLIAAVSACRTAQDESPRTTPAQEPALAEAANPMASFARMAGGEWQVTFASGTRALHAWQWGPGQHSLRKMTNGSEGVGNPWAGEVMYWHPGARQVRVLSLHEDIPGVGRGVGEGTITFDGETAAGLLDLHQPRGHRKLASRWVFDGPDKYRDVLLEDGGSGFGPLNELVFSRVPARAELPAPVAQGNTGPSGRLRAFDALVGHTWRANGRAYTGGSHQADGRVQSTFQWIPSLQAVWARSMSLGGEGTASTHLLDAYFIEPIGSGPLRCLALTNQGCVHEGDVTVLDGGALQLELTGYEADRVVRHIVHLEVDQGGTLRHRVWSLEGTERAVVLDIHHRKLDPPND
jgi:hypothetical protein